MDHRLTSPILLLRTRLHIQVTLRSTEYGVRSTVNYELAAETEEPKGIVAKRPSQVSGPACGGRHGIEIQLRIRPKDRAA